MRKAVCRTEIPRAVSQPRRTFKRKRRESNGGLPTPSAPLRATSRARAISVARKTMAIVRQNIIFAIGVKVIILVLAAFGIANMWLAVFGDVGVAVIAILNAMRAMSVKEL